VCLEHVYEIRLLLLGSPGGGDVIERGGRIMDQVVERAGALDVHKEQVTACVRVPGEGSRGRRQLVREFKATVRGLLALRDWLAEHGVTHVAMEATGVYWWPVWAILEEDFECTLCNAQHVKNVALV